ncbi:MAG TPA: hypothetical protein VGB20_07225 [bacterium]
MEEERNDERKRVDLGREASRILHQRAKIEAARRHRPGPFANVAAYLCVVGFVWFVNRGHHMEVEIVMSVIVVMGIVGWQGREANRRMDDLLELIGSEPEETDR